MLIADTSQGPRIGSSRERSKLRVLWGRVAIESPSYSKVFAMSIIIGVLFFLSIVSVSQLPHETRGRPH